MTVPYGSRYVADKQRHLILSKKYMTSRKRPHWLVLSIPAHDLHRLVLSACDSVHMGQNWTVCNVYGVLLHGLRQEGVASAVDVTVSGDWPDLCPDRGRCPSRPRMYRLPGGRPPIRHGRLGRDHSHTRCGGARGPAGPVPIAASPPSTASPPPPLCALASLCVLPVPLYPLSPYGEPSSTSPLTCCCALHGLFPRLFVPTPPPPRPSQ